MLLTQVSAAAIAVLTAATTQLPNNHHNPQIHLENSRAPAGPLTYNDRRPTRLALGCALPASGQINKPKGILFEVRISQPEKRQVLAGAGGGGGADVGAPRLLNLLQE